MKKLKIEISICALQYGCGVPPRGYIPILGPVGPPRTDREGLKVYLVSYTNNTDDLEAIFEISYFHPTQKSKSPICNQYGQN